jgi:hypothetical protein
LTALENGRISRRISPASSVENISKKRLLGCNGLGTCAGPLPRGSKVIHAAGRALFRSI